MIPGVLPGQNGATVDGEKGGRGDVDGRQGRKLDHTSLRGFMCRDQSGPNLVAGASFSTLEGLRHGLLKSKC